ncbi:MAG: histidine phosphatase family protein [Patescibacteria group bacterium]
MQLVIVRHGKYGMGDHLSEEGRDDIAAVGAKLKAMLNGIPEIHASPVTRAKESSQVLQSILGGDLIEDAALTANYLRDIDFLSPEKAKAYLAALPTDRPIILVTHVDICALLLGLFGSSIALDRGEAAIIQDENPPERV